MAGVAAAPGTERTTGDGRVPDAFWTRPPDDLLAALDSRRAGLSSAEAAARRRRAGTLHPHHRRTELVILLRQFANPITLILVAATVVSGFLSDVTDAAIILAIVLLSGLLSFWQEYAASRAVEDLLAAVHVTVEVWRDGTRVFVPSAMIVPGDVVVLDTGDLIPGDCLLLDAHDVLVDEAPLTGESYPVEKTPGVLAAETPLAQRANCLFMGTHIVRGSATALVVRTGGDTAFGRVAAELEQRPPPTRFEQGLGAFGRLLLRVMVILVVLIFVANIVLARPLVDSLLFSVALAVGLTPQLLPAIVSVSLSVGARRTARARVIVKRLSAIEDFGGMDVLCTDKTGTLTQGAVVLAAALDLDGRPSARVLADATLNAVHHTGFANPIDDAIRAAGHVDASGTRLLDEIPYDFQRKRLSVLVAHPGTPGQGSESAALLTKGAVSSVLAVCADAALADGSIVPLARVRERIYRQFATLSAQGYRVLGVARREWTSGDVGGSDPLRPEDEHGLCFTGFLTFHDPPKPDAARLLRELAALGISLRMVTGDNPLVARYTARAVGLEDAEVLTGTDVRDLDDAELARRAATVTVFAEMDPVQKERLIRALRQAGHDVGYLGDGINDAPALHAADVGISVDTAVDVARDAASIVLLQKDLEVVMAGVRLGRQTFANTLKYIFVTTSANFGNMASMAVVSPVLPFLPLLPLQILLINFLSDLPGTTIATDSVDPEQLQRPGAWDLRFIRGFMVIFGLVSSCFDLLTFAVLRLGFDADAVLFRSGWFLESVATELAVMLVLRTRRPFFRSRPSELLLGSSLLVAVVTLALPFSPWAADLGMTDLPIAMLLTLAAITAGYIVATEAAKARVYRRVVRPAP